MMTDDFVELSLDTTNYLLRCGIEAAILIPLILLIQQLSGDRLSPTVKHALWIILLIRLSIPAFPESGLSLFNLADKIHREELSKNETAIAHTPERDPLFQISQEPTRTILRQEPILSSLLDDQTKTASTTPNASSSIPAIVRSSGSIPSSKSRNNSTARQKTMGEPVQSISIPKLSSWREWTLATWLAGITFLLIRITKNSLTFRRRLKKSVPIQNFPQLRIFENAKKAMGIKKNVLIYQSTCVTSPAVYGLFKLRILLPESALDSYSERELFHVLSHELAHIQRQDAIWNLWSTIIQLIHWPNPMIWFATRRIRSDRELATDFLALQENHEIHPVAYGETILKTLQTIPSQKLAPGMLGIAEDRNNLCRRFNMIACFNKNQKYSRAIAAIIVAMLVFTSLTSPISQGRAAVEASESPSHNIKVFVTDVASGGPLSNVEITTAFGGLIGYKTRETTTVRTDQSGLAILEITNPPGPETWFTIYAIPERVYISQFRSWKNDKGIWNQLPLKHEFQLEKGTAIGGKVIDAQGAPITDVSIALMGYSQAKGRNQFEENVSRLNAPLELGIKTDAQGLWKCSLAPVSARNFQLTMTKPNGAAHHCSTPIAFNGRLLFRNGSPIVSADLYDKSCQVVFPEGSNIKIVVTDGSGQHVPGAEVRELTGTIYRKLGTTAITDEMGTARFNGRLAHELGYIVTHPSFATTSGLVAPIDGETAITIIVEPKKPLVGRILDRSGNPVTDAVIDLGTETNEAFYVDWSERSDTQGRFTWENAPLSKTFYRIRADGFRSQVIQAAPDDGPVQIILDSPSEAIATHTLNVVDAITNFPIPAFSYSRKSDFPLSFGKPIPGKDGRSITTCPPDEFTGTNTPFFTEIYTIECRAPGYRNALSRIISMNEVRANILVKLQPTSNKRSFENVTILSPFGDPAGGAIVNLVSADDISVPRISYLGKDHGRINPYNNPYLKANSQGILQEAMLPLSFRGVAIVDSRGSIEIPASELDLSKKSIQLAPLGKVNGTLQVNGLTTKDLRIGLRAIPNENGLIAGTVYSTTTEGGHFTFENIPSGNYRLFRSNTAINYHSGPDYYSQNLQVRPGKTTFVDYHIDGQTVVGRFRTNPLRTDFNWQESDPWWQEGAYTLKAVNKIEDPILSPRQDQYLTVSRLNKSKIHFKQRSRELEASARPNSYTFPLDVNPDGNFTVTSVPPGEYKLEAIVVETLGIEKGTIRKRTLGYYSQRLNIPTGPTENTIYLGTITIPIIPND